MAAPGAMDFRREAEATRGAGRRSGDGRGREWPRRIVALVPPALEIVQWRETRQQTELVVRYPQRTAVCPACQVDTAQVHSRRIQRKRDQDWERKPLWLLLERRRFRCWRCQTVFTEPDPVCGARRRTTTRRRHDA